MTRLNCFFHDSSLSLAKYFTRSHFTRSLCFKALFCSAFLLLTLGVLPNAYGAEPLRPSGKLSMESLAPIAELPDRSEGSAKAPVTIIEYGSLTCPHCANFLIKVMPKLRKTYIDKGNVRYIFREFPFDPPATAGFMLARCAPKDRYHALLEVLFQQASNWAFSGNVLEDLARLAKLSGFDEAKFKNCLENKQLLQALNKSTQKAISLGIEALPTFFINGDKYQGEMSFEEISQIIDTHLKKK